MIENVNQRVDRGQNVGIVVGIIGPNRVEYYGYGTTRVGISDRPDENTIFEIGSITKTLTATLLADNVVRGSMNLDDPVQHYLPNQVAVPAFGNEQITLEHLSSHVSSLPRLPSNLRPADSANPYADYTVDMMYEFLTDHELRRPVGSEFEYSNLGFGLLGHTLGLHAGVPYEELMIQRIAQPLNMTSTTVTISEDLQRRFATGHHLGNPVIYWDFPSLAGTGAIRSSVKDMLKYLAANMNLIDVPAGYEPNSNHLLEAMLMTHEARVDAYFGMDVGLGWHIRTNGDLATIWHNGGTGGFRSFIGFNRGGDLGVVVLSNSSAGVDDIGFHMLDPRFLLQKARYSAADLIGDAMMTSGIDAAWETYHDMRDAEGDDYDFNESAINGLGYEYLRKGSVDAAVAVFEMNADRFPDSANTYDSLGEALLARGDTSLAVANYKKSLEMAPGNTNARNVLDDLGIMDESAYVDVPGATLQSYVGEYEFSPSFILSITLEGNQLRAQATGQEAHNIFPSSETEFYWKVVNAQLTFNVGEKGRAVSATLHQGGADVTGIKRE